MTTAISRSALLLLLGSIALIVLPHFWNLSHAVIGFFYFLLSWRLLGVYQPHFLPNKWVLFLLTLIGIGILYQQHQGILGRNAGTVIFITALGLKLLEIKSTRDLYFIVFLAFIVAATLFLYHQSIAMAAYIVAVCIGLLSTLIAANMQVANIVKAFKLSLTLIFQALPLGITLFILFPRLEAPHWSFLQDKSKTKTGLSETLEPGSISDMALSDELVFRVKFKDAMPPSHQRYWRGPVFTFTNGKTWLPRNGLELLNANKTKVSGEAYQYTLLMEPQAKNWVFALDMPQQLSSPLKMTAQYQVISDLSPSVHAEYNLESYSDYNTGDLSETERQENLQLPHNVSPAILALVKQLQGIEQNQNAYIQQVLNHFRSQDFYYSLSPPLMEENPIDTFLFKTRTGFCSHFATAFVYLMRVAHIPARVVSGFQGGELNSLGNFLEIKQADAHAWTEVWLKNKGWVRIDPTAVVAPERLENGVNVQKQIASGLVSFDIDNSESTASQVVNNLRQTWKNMDYSWQRWVINYNTSNQASFLSAFGLKNMQSMLTWMMGIISLFIAGLFWWLIRKPKVHLDETVKLYQGFTQKLSKVKILKQASETPNDFAARVIKTLPEHRERIQNITDLFVMLRYGKQVDPAIFMQLKNQIKAFKPASKPASRARTEKLT